MKVELKRSANLMASAQGPMNDATIEALMKEHSALVLTADDKEEWRVLVDMFMQKGLSKDDVEIREDRLEIRVGVAQTKEA